jgi:hypothetical protein
MDPIAVDVQQQYQDTHTNKFFALFGDLFCPLYMSTVNRFVEFGREDGLAAGGRNGAIEGRVMGCEKGFELSREVGYYAGCAQLWKAVATLDQERISEKYDREKILGFANDSLLDIGPLFTSVHTYSFFVLAIEL